MPGLGQICLPASSVIASHRVRLICAEAKQVVKATAFEDIGRLGQRLGSGHKEPIIVVDLRIDIPSGDAEPPCRDIVA